MSAGAVRTPGSRWLHPLKAAAPGAGSVVCFPFGGGSSAAFRPLLPHLPAEVGLVGVDLPGRAARFGEPLLHDWRAVVDGLLAVRDELARFVPLVLFGHSLGALVAFELARALERAGGTRAAHVVVSGRGAPDQPRIGAPIHALDDARFLDELQKYQGTPRELLDNPELLEIFLPILRADFAISETYDPGPGRALATDLTVLGGTRDAMVDVDGLEAWRRYTRGRFELRTFDAGHFFIFSHAGEVARLLASRLPRRLLERASG